MLRKSSEVPVIMGTAKGAEEERIMGLRQGADDYIAKPFDHDDMLSAVARIIEQTKADSDQQPTSAGSPIAGIIGRCSAMQQLQKGIHKVAPTDSTVLILGETGTGKELVAKAVHAESSRATDYSVAE